MSEQEQGRVIPREEWVEEPVFDWTEWAEPMTDEEVAQLPSQEELGLPPA